VKLPRIDLLVWCVIAFVVLAVAAILYRIGAAQQHHDERLLSLEPSTTLACRCKLSAHVLRTSHPIEREENGFVVSKTT
jgi:hypothetical protein